MNVNVVVTSTNATKLTKLETEEKRIVRGATPEQEELKAKQLSEKAHVDPTLQSNYKFARTNFTTKTQRTRRQDYQQEETEQTEARLEVMAKTGPS